MKQHAIYTALFSLIVFLVVGFLGIQITRADTTITVTTLTDEVSTNGNCSLREAIQAVNSDAAVDACSADSNTSTIILPAGTYYLTGGSLIINSDISIIGSGAASTIIDGNESDRVLYVGSGNAQVVGTTITHGRLDVADKGAGLFVSFGSAVTVTGCVVSSNSIVSAANAYGGGIFNAGTLILNNTIVRDNTINGDLAYGGGIFNNPGGYIDVINSTVTGNTAMARSTNGGGIFNSSNLTVANSTISYNSASGSAGFGGGVFNVGIATLTNSTLNNNTASIDGGGIYSQGGQIAAINDTITANGAGRGGGLFHFNGLFTLINTTVSSNVPGGGIHNDINGPVILRNAIVAYNESNCMGAAVISSGHNLESGNSCGFNGLGDLNSIDPLLGSLQDNGGMTLTLALLSGSPAIDMGDNVDCPTADQRGFGRDASCDIGAYEFNGTPPAVFTPTPTLTPTPTETLTPSPTSTATYTPTPSATPTPSPSQAIDDLTNSVSAYVASGDVDEQLQRPLNRKLQNAQQSLLEGQIDAAVHQLQAFINQIEAQRGKKITTSAADDLIAHAQAIITQLQSAL